jgi:Predicted ATPase with chaperone activity
VQAADVTVECDLGPGLPTFAVVGLAETAVKEARDRVRSAIQNSGFEFPARRMVVNLAPADLPKEGGRFDLPMAIGILAASGQLPAAALKQLEMIGELALDGSLRPVTGTLSSTLAAGQAHRAILVPQGNAQEAAFAQSAPVFACANLAKPSPTCAARIACPRSSPMRRPRNPPFPTPICVTYTVRNQPSGR